MKIKESYIRTVIQEEINNLTEDLDKDEEKEVAHHAYILLGKAREKFEEHLGELQDGEEPSDEFKNLFGSVADAWKTADKILTGGETRDALPDLFSLTENQIKESLRGAVDALSELNSFLSSVLEEGDLSRANEHLQKLSEEIKEVLMSQAMASGGVPAGEKRPVTFDPRGSPVTMRPTSVISQKSFKEDKENE